MRRDSTIITLIAIGGLLLRLAHNSAMSEIPLYFQPIGGHTAFLDLAKAIAGGDLLPGTRPFTENSILFPYLLAAQFLMAGGVDYLFPRICGIVVDTATIVMVFRIARVLFNQTTAILAALAYAIYGPAVFFSAELIYIPYTNLLLALAVWNIVRPSPGYLFAGLTFGLAVTTMPSLILGAPLFLLVPWLSPNRVSLKAGALLAAGIACAVMPVTIANYTNSGELVLLTTSGGHNFYIGHNPESQVGYYLPEHIGTVRYANRGSIFDSMKGVAEGALNTSLKDSEVSGFYFNQAIESILAAPGREFTLLRKRLFAAGNDYEATTYSSYYFAREHSPTLRFLPTFQCLFPFALLGILASFGRKTLPALLPILISVLTIVGFFYISRFRMPAIPFVAIFAGFGVTYLLATFRSSSWFKRIGSFLIVGVAAVWGSYPTVPKHGANEWNKLGAIYRFTKRPEQAESAFARALSEDPTNQNAKRNLILLYRELGRAEEAENLSRQLMPTAENTAIPQALK